MQRLQLTDLLSALTPKQSEQQQPVVQSHSDTTTQQFLTGPSLQVRSLPLKQQLKIKRESTYRYTQQQMDKWVGIVKLNRQKDSLNLVAKQKDNAASVGFFPAVHINDFHNKIESQLKSMEIQSQQAVIKKEEHALVQLSKEEAQQRLKESRKQRTAQFNLEIKRRRIAKIKSKLYHKIKKRQKLREEAQRVGEMKGQQKKEYMEKLTKKRVQQRISLRHKSKNKHIQNLLRFSKGNQQSIQDSINEVNKIRQQQLEKVNDQFIEEMSDDDNSNAEEELEELQHQIDQMEEQSTSKKGLDSMKFMQNGLQKELNQQKKDLKTLAKMFQTDDPILDDNDQHKHKGELTRQIFGVGSLKSKSDSKASSYIERNLQKALGNQQMLTEGINLTHLKEKYQPQRSDLNITEAINIQKQAFLGTNEVVQQNYRQFEKHKDIEYEAEVSGGQKNLKGWGTWAGPGISEPKIDQAAEVRRKLLKIEEIKRKRRDGEMAGVIIGQSYNKELKDYLVNKLPYNIKSGDQLNYLQSEPIGPEWNTLTQFSANIRPKVITKAGQVIEPIKMPKHIGKAKK